MTESDQLPDTSGRADDARTRILDAAMREFGANGLAGGRTERIAESAGVNKALLYYYFRSKEALYAAALDLVSLRVAESSLSVMSRECSAGERLLRFTLNHFDRIYSQPVFQNLMQQEMIRLRKGESNATNPLVEKLFKPMGDRMLAVVQEGVRSGEIIQVESTQITYAALGANVFYFLSAPLMHLIGGTDPLEHASLRFRRKAAIEFLGHALFVDRAHGIRVADRVLRDTPMPTPGLDGEFKPIQDTRLEETNIEPVSSSAKEARRK